jgi:hypothetical protein
MKRRAAGVQAPDLDRVEAGAIRPGLPEASKYNGLPLNNDTFEGQTLFT